MLNALIILGANWLSLWDFHEKTTLSLELVVTTFFLVVGQYFMSALIAPDFEGEDGYDMQEFHRRERRTYLGALAVPDSSWHRCEHGGNRTLRPVLLGSSNT